jgi:hypothetical protein
MVSIELDVDQTEQIGIAYIKQCYETLLETLDGCEPTEDDAKHIESIEGMLGYVLTVAERVEYFSYCQTQWPRRQTSLTFA